MREGESSPAVTGRPVAPRSAVADVGARRSGVDSILMTEVSPFHCLYQDALDFHSQSRLMLARSVGSASRLARAALLLYVGASEALIHQAAVELARPDLASFLADPSRPIPLADAWRLLSALVGDRSSLDDPAHPPWPQFFELLMLRSSWAHPGDATSRRAYYRSTEGGSGFEPLLPHQVPAGLPIKPEALHYPKTGLPRDPYALRPVHLDTARGIIDAAVEALDRRLDGALTRDNRHRREPTRLIHPPAHESR